MNDLEVELPANGVQQLDINDQLNLSVISLVPSVPT